MVYLRDIYINIEEFASVGFTLLAQAYKRETHNYSDQCMFITMLFSRFVGNKVGTDGTGALLSLRHPITLKDSNIFQGNMGGALSLFQARMDVSGQVLFENNTALNGGGMLMFELSIVCYYQVAIAPAIPHDIVV